MSSNAEKCNFTLEELKQYACPYPVESDGQCIFHLRKFKEAEKQLMSQTEREEAERIEEKFLRDFLKTIDSEIEGEDFHNYIGFNFPRIILRDLTFKRRADFRHSTFVQYTEFGRVSFVGGVDFTKARFFQAVFWQTTFNQYASFEKSTFSRQVKFNKVTFDGSANFHNTEFPDQTLTFHLSTFNQEAMFTGASFGEGHDSQVGAEANFSRVTFNKTARFDKAVFNSKANFDAAEFCGEANFIQATFNKDAMFTRTEFKGEAKFWGASFIEVVNLYSAKVAGEVNFIGAGDNKCFQKECNFRRVHLSKDATLSFDSVSLSKASFFYTNLEKVTFSNVVWFRPEVKLKTKFRGRPRLWDEQKFSKNDDEGIYERIAENYRQLVINYEDKRDYDLAEDFHIGEMETRRKKAGIQSGLRAWRKIRKWVNTYYLYRLLSNYGSSYVKAFLMLLMFMAFFSGAFLYSGFRPGEDNLNAEAAAGSSGVIEYNALPDEEHQNVSLTRWLSDYGKAILFTLSVITFQRERHYEAVGWQSQLWLYLAVVVVATQAALMLLSVRRRFRR